MGEFSTLTRLSNLRSLAPEFFDALAVLGLNRLQDEELTVEQALEVLHIPRPEDVLTRHLPLWRSVCDVCWPHQTVTTLIRHILEQHHEFLRLELPRLQFLLHRALNREAGGAASTAKAILEAFVPLKAEIEMHLLKEEQILFPLCEQLENASEPFMAHCGSVRNPIGVMMAEHDNAKQALARIREVTEKFSSPEEASPSMRALYAALRQLERDLTAHIREEDDILFPRVVAIEDELFQR